MITKNNNSSQLPEGWVWTTIDNILRSLESGGRPKGGVKGITEGVPSIGGEHLKYGGTFNFTKLRYVPRAFFEKMTKGKIRAKDVLVVKDGATTGKTAYVPESFPFNEAAVNEHVFILRVFEELTEPKFLSFWMQAGAGQKCVKDNFQGTAQGGINSQFVKNSRLPFAPLPEQQRIVAKIEELFTRLDAGVEALKKVRQELKRYRQAVLKAAFEGKLTSDEFTNGLPVGWKQMTLQEITLEKQGLRRGPFGSSIKKAFFVPRGYKVYEQGNAINDDPYRGHYYISKDKYQELENFKVIPGDLLVSCSGVTLGRIVQIPSDAEPGVINQALLRIRLRKELIETKYFIYLFRSEVFQKMVFARSRGTAMPNLVGIKQFRLIPVKLPPISEQRKIIQEIERHFSITDEIEQTIEESLKQSKRLRQSILKKAFEGKLVPQDPEDEPAEKLLERIKAEKAKLLTDERLKKEKIGRRRRVARS